MEGSASIGWREGRSADSGSTEAGIVVAPSAAAARVASPAPTAGSPPGR